MAPRNLWTREEMTVVLDLYFKLPFGRLNKSTPEVVELAALIGRSVNSVALRLVNYAACDPYILATGRHGMDSGRKTCQPYWDEFVNNKEALFFEAQKIRAKLSKQSIEQILKINDTDFIGYEREAVIRARVNQQAFRTMILTNYENKCAVSGIDIPTLLVASHIVPWADDMSNRLNPENGTCLSPLYDRLFDKGLITVREDYTIQLSKELYDRSSKEYFSTFLKPIQDKKLRMPIEHIPKQQFLQYHNERIFLG